MNRDGMMRNDTKPHTGHMHIQNILYDRKSRFIVSLTFVVEFSHVSRGRSIANRGNRDIRGRWRGKAKESDM
jgi:hypothetical protein